MARYSDPLLEELALRQAQLQGVPAPAEELGPQKFNTIVQKPAVTPASVTNNNPAKESPSSPVPATPPADPLQRAYGTKIPGLQGTTWGDLVHASERLPEMEAQRQALQQQKMLLENELKRSPQIDLTPAAAFVDSLYGTKISGGIKSPEDRTALRAKLMNQIQTGHQGVTEEQRRFIRDMLGLGESRRGAASAKGDERLFKDFAKQAKTYQEVMDASKRAHDTLSSGGPISENAVQIMLARASGEKGVLSDQDIARWSGSPDLLSRAQRAAAKAFEGHKFTEADREELYALSKVYSSRSMEDLEGLRMQYAGAAPSYQANTPLFMQSSGAYIAPLRKREADYAKKDAARKEGKTIRVKDKASGQTGSLPENEFDASKYEKL